MKQDQLYERLETLISSARLNAYRRRLEDADDLDVLAHYYWNVALSRALFLPLEAFEVALRNRLHAAISRAHSTDRWFDDPTGPALTVWHRGEVTTAIEKLRKRDRRVLRITNPPYPETGRIIAELNLGFWVGLFGKDYAEQTHTLWRGNLIVSAFPHIPPDEPSSRRNRTRYRSRQALSVRLNRVLRLRNRVFHHEPIWYWREPPISNLGEQHNELIELVYWMDPAAASLVTALDDFPSVYGAGPAAVRRTLQEHFHDATE